MSDADDIRAELEAAAREIAERFVFGAPIDRSADLDQARDMVEDAFGVPCIAQYADGGRMITVSRAFGPVDR